MQGAGSQCADLFAIADGWIQAQSACSFNSLDIQLLHENSSGEASERRSHAALWHQSVRGWRSKLLEISMLL